MKRFLLPSLLCVWIAPAFAAPSEKLPPEVRAMMPKKIVSLRTFRVAPAPKAPQLILHLWSVPDRDFEPAKRYGYGKDVSSPFVLDVFTDEKKPRYRASLILATHHAPTKINLWYLNAKTKDGLVFEVIDDTGSDDSHHEDTTTFFVFPFWPGTYLTGWHGTHQTSQSFKSNIRSGNYATYHVERDSEGLFRLIHWSGGGSTPVVTHEVLTWERGEERFIVTQYVDFPRSRTWRWDRENRQFVLTDKKAAPK